MIQQVNRLKNYEQKLQFTLSKLEPQYRLPTENSINHASQPNGILKQSLNANNSYISFLESIAPQSNKAASNINRNLFGQQNADPEEQNSRKEMLLPQISNSNQRSKSENKNSNTINTGQRTLLISQQNQRPFLQQIPQQQNRLSQSRNQIRNSNYNFYALPQTYQTEAKDNSQDFDQTNSSNLWNELNQLPNMRYANTTKHSKSNKITLQYDEERQSQSKEQPNRSSTIDPPLSTTNKGRNYVTNLQIYNNAMNRLDTTSPQYAHQPLSKHMINIKSIVKNSQLAPISQSSNYSNKFQDLSLNNINEQSTATHFRFSNECFSTPHRNLNNNGLNHSRMITNKSYEYDLRIKSPPTVQQSLQLPFTTEKSVQTEVDEDKQSILLNENITINAKKIQLQTPNRNHLKTLNNNSNRYNRHNYVLNEPIPIQQNQLIQQKYSNSHLNNNDETPPIYSQTETDRSSVIDQTFHHASMQKNQYMIDERKVVNIQIQNQEMDSYIRQVQKYVFKQQHTATNETDQFIKKQNIIHPGDLDLSQSTYLKMNLVTQQKEQTNLTPSLNSRPILIQSNDINQQSTNQLNKDIHIESPLDIQQHFSKRSSPKEIKLDKQMDQQYISNLLEQTIVSQLEEEQSQKHSRAQSSKDLSSKKESQSQSKRNSESVDGQDHFYQLDNEFNKQMSKSKRNQLNETITRQYSFSVCYEDKGESQPQSRGSLPLNQTPKLNSETISKMPTQKGSLSETPNKNESNNNNNLLQVNQMNEDEFFQNKRSAEFGTNEQQQSQNQGIKVHSQKQLHSKKAQLELLQDENLNQSKYNSSQNSNQDSLKQQLYQNEGDSASKRNLRSKSHNFEGNSQKHSVNSSAISSAQQTSPKEISSHNSPSSSPSKQKSQNKGFPNQPQSANIEINMYEISIPNSNSALESHQTASLISSKKSSMAQSFQRGTILKRDPSSRNSIGKIQNKMIIIGSSQGTSKRSSQQTENNEMLNHQFEQDQIHEMDNRQPTQLQHDLNNHQLPGNSQIHLLSQLDSEKQNMLLNSQHQFYERERRRIQKRLNHQHSNIQIQDSINEDEEHHQSVRNQSLDNNTKGVSLQKNNQQEENDFKTRGQLLADPKNIQENQNTTQDRRMEIQHAIIADMEELNQQIAQNKIIKIKQKKVKSETEPNYDRVDSKDSSQWLRDNIMVKTESPSLTNRANSTQKSFKSRSKDSTRLSFHNSNLANAVNIGGSSEEPQQIVKQYNQFKKQGFIKQNYRETKFVSSSKKSQNTTPKKKSINEINFSPSNDQSISDKLQQSPLPSNDNNLLRNKNIQNSSEISFQSPYKFNN